MCSQSCYNVTFAAVLFDKSCPFAALTPPPPSSQRNGGARQPQAGPARRRRLLLVTSLPRTRNGSNGGTRPDGRELDALTAIGSQKSMTYGHLLPPWRVRVGRAWRGVALLSSGEVLL